MKKIIVSGKGGSGKTTVSSLLIKYLSKNHPNKRILAIDADEAFTLSYSLDTHFDINTLTPIGELKIEQEGEHAQLLKDFKEKSVVKYDSGSGKIDFAYMGHHQSNSCLCGYNNILKQLVTALEKNDKYDLVVIDREAGLEHLTRNVYASNDDLLLMVSWLSQDYLHVIKEIIDTAHVLGSTKNQLLIINDIFDQRLSNEEVSQFLEDNKINIPLTAILPKIQNVKQLQAADFPKNVTNIFKDIFDKIELYE